MIWELPKVSHAIMMSTKILDSLTPSPCHWHTHITHQYSHLILEYPPSSPSQFEHHMYLPSSLPPFGYCMLYPTIHSRPLNTPISGRQNRGRIKRAALYCTWILARPFIFKIYSHLVMQSSFLRDKTSSLWVLMRLVRVSWTGSLIVSNPSLS